MIACVVIKFLYEGPQEIGTLVNIQFNQYHGGLLHSSNFLKSCWLVAPIFINNFRKEILQRCWFRKESPGPKNTRFSPFVDTQRCFGEVGEMSFKLNTLTLLCDCSAHGFLSVQAWKRIKSRFKLGQIESTLDYIQTLTRVIIVEGVKAVIKCAYCRSHWTKASTKCPKCICQIYSFFFLYLPSEI